MSQKSSQGSWLCLYYLIIFATAKGKTKNEELSVDIAKLKSNIQNISKEYYELKLKMKDFNPYCQTLASNICGPCNCRDDDHLKKKYYCDCQNLTPKRDCLEFYQNGMKVNGIYKIHQNILKIIQVYCDQNTNDGGGWTVIQRRRDGSVNFYRTWEDYRAGFGQLQNEFWLGNDHIFTLTLQGLFPKGNELRFDMVNWKGVHQYALYKKFQVGNQDTRYVMHLSQHSGTATNIKSFEYHNGMKFSTFDFDNDLDSRNCGRNYKSGWWFKTCFGSNLNGVYRPGGEVGSRASGIHWSDSSFFNSHDDSLLYTEMKVRRRV